MLEELGQASIVEQEGRKAYAITDAGRVELEKNIRSVEDFYSRTEGDSWEFNAQDVNDLWLRVARLVKTFKLAGRRSRLTPETIRAIAKVLDQAIDGIEDILNGSRR
jgi:DNA-binding PadR family transcriptional regulator